MATVNEGNHRTYQAGANLSAKQYFIVKLSGSDVVLASAATDSLLGVLENAPADNDAASVRLRSSSGVGKVKAGGAITVGAALTTDGNGEAIVTTTDGDHIIGFAVTAGDDGDIVEYTPSNSRLYIA